MSQLKNIKDWQDGLKECDIKKIKSALDAGVPPATYVDGHHPLRFIFGASGKRGAKAHFLLSALFGEGSDSGTPDQSADLEKSFEDLSEIIDLLVSRGLSLTEKQKHKDQTVIDSLLEYKDNRKDKFTLFVAGYKEPMLRFIQSNEGLSSRIKVFEENRDFTTEELAVILDNNIDAQGYVLDPEAHRLLLEGIAREKQACGGAHFGNARVVVSLVQELPNQMADRLGVESEGRFGMLDKLTLSTITVEDVRAALSKRGPGDKSGFEQEKSRLPSFGFTAPVSRLSS